MNRATEIKVGALVLGAVTLLALMVLVIGDFNFDKGQEIKVDYVFVGSLQPGAAVRTSGIKVGRVEAIDFMGGEANPKTGEPIQIRLTLWIEERALNNVREDSQFLINTEGVLGEQYVEIIPGSPSAKHIEPGETVRGNDPPRTDLMIQKAFELVDSLNNLMSGKGEKFDKMVESMGRLIETTDSLVNKNKDQFGPLMVNLNKLTAAMADGMSTTGEIRAIIADTRVVMAAMRKDIVPISGDMRQAVENFKTVGENTIRLTDPKTGTLTKAIGGFDQGIAHVDRSVTSFEKAVDNVDKLVDRLDEILGRVEAGPASLFLSDREDAEEANAERKEALKKKIEEKIAAEKAEKEKHAKENPEAEAQTEPKVQPVEAK